MGWRCHTCGEEHEGLPLDWAFDSPAYWDWLTDEQKAEGYLNPDVCSFQEDGRMHFFVRGVLQIPLLDDDDDVFAYGVWASLSEPNFERMLELWDEPDRAAEPPYFGWLSNRLPGYPETLGLKTDVVTRTVELRPAIVLQSSDHPLTLEQQRGITRDRVLEIAEQNMHGVDAHGE